MFDIYNVIDPLKILNVYFASKESINIFVQSILQNNYYTILTTEAALRVIEDSVSITYLYLTVFILQHSYILRI